jgi:xanthine dehydrogenase accessory factor
MKIEWELSEHHQTNSARKSIEGTDMFFGVLSPTPEIILIGGGEISIELSKIALNIGYEVVIIEPRAVFNSSKRFLGGVRIIKKWPQEAFEELSANNNSALVALSHDPKFDDPAIIFALQTEMFYIGALGSVRSHKKRLKRLESSVLEKTPLESIKSPVGVDIGAQTPQEIAVSILAEVIKTRNSK